MENVSKRQQPDQREIRPKSFNGFSTQRENPAPGGGQMAPKPKRVLQFSINGCHTKFQNI